MKFLLPLVLLACLMVQLAMAAPSGGDATSAPASPSQASPKRRSGNPNPVKRNRKEIVDELAKAQSVRPEEIEEVATLLKIYREKKQKEKKDREAKVPKKQENKQVMERLSKRAKAVAASKSSKGTKDSIPATNAAELSEFMLEGDIVLSVNQARRLAEGKPLNVAGKKKPDWWHHIGENRRNETEFIRKVEEQAAAEKRNKALRAKRQAFNPETEPELLWTNGYMPYLFDPSVTDAQKTLIDKAVGYWNWNTCLWLQKDLAMIKGSPRIVFTSVGAGCSSGVGNDRPGNHTVTLKASGCMRVGIISHEIAHAAGLWHAHTRHDREDWVDIKENNIEEPYIDSNGKLIDHTHNFDIKTTDENENFGIQYDLGSVMHYAYDAFGKEDDEGNKAQTIVTMPNSENWEWDNTIGSRLTGPTLTDYKVINKLYNCADVCAAKGISKSCSRGGFQNPASCNNCVCPPGLGGTDCTTPVPVPTGFAPSSVSNTCNGGVITVPIDGEWIQLDRSIGSSSWSGHSNQDFAYCHHYLKTSSGYHIEIELLEVAGNCDSGCSDSYTEIKMSDSTAPDYSKSGVHVCCDYDLNGMGSDRLTFESVGISALVSSYARVGVRSFSLQYRAVQN